MTTPTYRKPKKIAGALEQHTDTTTREYRLCYANQVLGLPSSLIEELTGIKLTLLPRCYDNTAVVPLELFRRADRFLHAALLLEELRCLPCSDYGVIRSVMGLGYTCRNLEEQLEELNVDAT